MSPAGVGGEASVTLTLADTQGLLSGALDTVTLNIAAQVGAHLSRRSAAAAPVHGMILKLCSLILPLISLVNVCFQSSSGFFS